MLKIFDQVESLVMNNIVGSPIYYDFSSGTVEIKVKPKIIILDSTKTISADNCYNLNNIFYIQNNNFYKLTPDQYQINDDGSITIVDDNILQGTVFLTNIPKLTLGINGNNQELIFNNIKPSKDKEFYVLSTNIINTTINSFTTEITGYPGTALKYNVNKFNGEKFKPDSSIECRGSMINPQIVKDTILIDENWWNSVSKPFGINYDTNITLGTYYRNTSLAINSFSSNEINLDFNGSCILISNISNNSIDYSSLFELNAHYYGSIKNLKLIFKGSNSNTKYWGLISNVISYYGSSNYTLTFENCDFVFDINYDLAFYLNGSNFKFINCTFEIRKATSNEYSIPDGTDVPSELGVYHNVGSVSFENCKIKKIY